MNFVYFLRAYVFTYTPPYLIHYLQEKYSINNISKYLENRLLYIEFNNNK